MKVFISWSGEFSRKVAERLSIWIQIIIQTVDVFYSPEDIAKGENWGNRLSSELEQSNFGIVCLTPENITAPWIHFEAGALSKAANSRVSAIMLGISPSDVKGPLARLQNTACNREDFFHLFQSINNSSDLPLKPEILKNAFDNSCERLINDINDIIKDYTSRISTSKAGKDTRQEHGSDSDALQEILRLVRSLDNTRNAVNTSNSITTSDTSFPFSRKSSYQRFIVTVRCSQDSIDKALPLIIKYAVYLSALLPQFEQELRESGHCSIVIAADQLFVFSQELLKTGAAIIELEPYTAIRSILDLRQWIEPSET